MAGDATEEEEIFQQAAEWIRTNETLKLSTEQKLMLYGLFKQASVGPCNSSRPSIFDMQGRHKWDAWHKLGTLCKVDAMASYIKLVTDLDPQWQENTCIGQVPRVVKQQGGGGPVISTLMKDDKDAIPDGKKNMFDWCKDGDVSKLAAMVTEKEVNVQDKDGLSMLHWACDRGHLETSRFLVATGADVNLNDSESQTALHYAASCGHLDLVNFLLSVPNIDLASQDCDGATPADVTYEPNIRSLLQHHMEQHNIIPP